MILVKFEWFMRDETDLYVEHIYAVYIDFWVEMWDYGMIFVCWKGLMLKGEFSEFNEEF